MPGIPHFINRKTEKYLNSSMQKMRPSEANPPAQVLVGGGVEPQKGTEPQGFRYCKFQNGTPERDSVTASYCKLMRVAALSKDACLTLHESFFSYFFRVKKQEHKESLALGTYRFTAVERRTMVCAKKIALDRSE